MTTQNTGNFFEDFAVGVTLRHAVPRTVHGGDLSLYIGFTGDRRPLHSSTEFARSLGYVREVVHDLLVFHIVFGKSVDDISLNATANLGYADVRFIRPVYPGDTLRAESEIVGLRETSKGNAGIVYVKTRGFNQKDAEVLSFYRWVLVPKRDKDAISGMGEVPTLPTEVAVADIPVPEALNLERFEDLMWATGGVKLWEDFTPGQRIHHPGGMTIDQVDSGSATRLYQNTARVHFDAYAMKSSRFGKRLVYGGHVISVAHALSYTGLENVLAMSAWNGGVHANPVFGGDTIYAFTDVLACAKLPGRRDVAALRLRLVAVKDADPSSEQIELPELSSPAKKKYDPRIVLDLDYWGLIPCKPELPKAA